jgi:hypothetical protein
MAYHPEKNVNLNRFFLWELNLGKPGIVLILALMMAKQPQSSIDALARWPKARQSREMKN